MNNWGFVRLVALLLPVVGLPQAVQRGPSTFDVYRNGIVHIGRLPPAAQLKTDNPSWIGTGFLVDGQCTFATAKHVIDLVGDGQLVVRLQPPQDRRQTVTRVARVLYRDDANDIAFIRVDRVNDGPCVSSGGGSYIFSLASGQIPLASLAGEHILIIGHPQIVKNDIDIPIIRTGIVASGELTSGDGTPTILLDLAGVPGFSGSPVILERTGEVVGIVYGPGGIERIFGFELATPLTTNAYKLAVSP